MITAEQFAAGAQQLASVWAARLPGEPPWHWLPSFAAAMGGGYLVMQRSLDVGPPPPPPQPLLQQRRQQQRQQQQQQQSGAPLGTGSQQPAAGGGGSVEEECTGSIADLSSESEQDKEGEDEEAEEAEEAEGGGEEEEEERDPANARQGHSTAASTAGTSAAAAQAAAARQRRLSLSCHIAYHLSYQVPVLYFAASDQSGAPLGLKALLAALPRLRAAVEGGQAHTVVTQEDHPFLRRPFFLLHPCQTEAIMALLTAPTKATAAAAKQGHPAPPASIGDGAAAEAAAAPGTPAVSAGRMCRYMLAWLSVSGQPLGLRLPPHLFLSDEN